MGKKVGGRERERRGEDALVCIYCTFKGGPFLAT
jgi:hypothetical protein